MGWGPAASTRRQAAIVCLDGDADERERLQIKTGVPSSPDRAESAPKSPLDANRSRFLWCGSVHDVYVHVPPPGLALLDQLLSGAAAAPCACPAAVPQTS